MKLTQVLWKQHLGRMTKRHWFAHGQQILGDFLSEDALTKRGIEVMDSKDLFFKKPHSFPRLDPVELNSGRIVQVPLPKNENNPAWKEKPCFRHENNDLLVAGTNQAQLLTKTLLVSDTLPKHIENLVEDTTEELDNILAGLIRTSNIFDAHQQKLPIKKDPLRPAWVFPRDYGIGQVRKSRNLSTKMIQLCESLSGSEIALQRQIIHDGILELTQEKDDDVLRFDYTFDMILMSTSGLKPMGSDVDTSELNLPNLHPLAPTISIHEDHFYELTDSYFVSDKSPWINAHTLFIYHDCENVKNITELPVTQDQLISRSLMKSYVAAACCAKKKFGNSVKDLPEPITVQCVQTDSQSFHFSVFQLNTLNIDSTNDKYNLWWSMPQINLYEKADYELGKPILTKYNPEVFKKLFAFYRNN